MQHETDQDDRPIYSDVGMFTRGRSGFRAEPSTTEKRDALWAVVALGIFVAIFLLVHLAMPTIR